MNCFQEKISIYILFLVAGLFTHNVALSQKGQSSKTDKIILDSLRALNTINKIDTFYYNENLKAALELIEKSSSQFDSLKISSFKNRFLIRRASIYRSNGEYGKALTDLNSVLENYQNSGDIKGEASALNHIGAVYRLRGDYPTALEYYFKSLKNYQSINDKSGISHQLNNIGVVYLYQKEYDKALEYYLQSLKIEEELNNDEGMGVSYLNIGEVYRKKKMLDKAIDYNLKALIYAKKTDDNDAIGTLYNEIAGINIEKGLINDVLKYLDKAKETFIKLGSKFRQAECEMNYGNYYLKIHNHTQALNHYNKALQLAKETGSMEIASNANRQLSILYDKANNTSKAYQYYKAYISLRDSLFNEENTRKSIQAEMFFKFERKQEELRIEQAKKDTIYAEKSQRQKIMRNFLLLIIGMGTFLIAVILLALKNIRKVNKDLQNHQNEILEKNEELQQQQEEILSQRDEIERKNLYLEQSRQIISEKNERMISSIEYAQTIQEALLPNDEDLKTIFKEYFVIFQPKDIVSGDFYWTSTSNNFTHIAVMDCTGHGVPGSFMSLIGNTLLNQIVNVWQIKNPALVLENLHEQLRKALKQNERGTKLHASIDIGFITIDYSKNKIIYAGANRPLIMVNEFGLTKISGDLRSTGGFQPEYERRFTNKEFDLISPSSLYLTTDGITDQMDPSKKKFGQKRLHSLLLEMKEKPLLKQKETLLYMLENHRKGEEQLDDICVLGIKI